MLVPRFHTGQVKSEVPSGDQVVVERGLQGVHYHPLSHVHLLAFDQVEYGARGFFALQTHMSVAQNIRKETKMEYSIYICWCDM